MPSSSGAAGTTGVDLNNNLTSLAFSVSGITFNPGAAAFVIGDGTTNPNVGNPFYTRWQHYQQQYEPGDDQ